MIMIMIMIVIIVMGTLSTKTANSYRAAIVVFVVLLNLDNALFAAKLVW